MVKLRIVCPVVKCGVWTVRSPELTWIVFQVGQHPWVGSGQPQELAQGCGSQRQQVRPQGHTVLLCTPGNLSKLHTGKLSDGVFQGQVGESRGRSTVKGNILFHLLLHRGVLEWKVHCFTHEIWFYMSASGRLILVSRGTNSNFHTKLTSKKVFMWFLNE